jgi:hypothetical protein
MNRLVAIGGAALIGAAVPILTPAQASADNCFGWNGRWFSTSTCAGGYYDGCSSVAIGPLWSSQCNPVPPGQQQPWQP